jgi:hypothetical protein
MLAPEAAAAFSAIGIPVWATILNEAIARFQPPYPRDQGERLALLDAIPHRGKRKDWDPFSELDDRFFAWLSQEEGDRWCRVADEYAARVA